MARATGPTQGGVAVSREFGLGDDEGLAEHLGAC
jgi:hypothetical protein